MDDRPYPYPNWKRVGFTLPPDPKTSGRGIGVLILDTLQPHVSLQHLGQRLIYVTVHDDLSVTTLPLSPRSSPLSVGEDDGEHGIMSMLLAAHAPFELNGQYYTGLAPAATYIVLNHGAFHLGESERLKRGMSWILERRDEWNLRIVLTTGWNTYNSYGWIEPTHIKPTVQGLVPAIEAGLLVIAANGNSRFVNELPPVEYLSVGGFNDYPLSTTSVHSAYPDQPWGLNGDGNLRPDILAPMLYLAIPYCEYSPASQPLSYAWYTSGASALVVGICAHILGKYPQLTPSLVRQALLQGGDPIAEYSNPAPVVNVTKTLELLEAPLHLRLPTLEQSRPIRIDQPEQIIGSVDPVERGLALTLLAKHNRCRRDQLWQHTCDPSHIVRKVAIRALEKPLDSAERERFWVRLETEPECGVRGYWAYGLLHDAPSEEFHRWIAWADDVNWSVRWCVSEYLAKHPGFLQLELTADLDLTRARAWELRTWGGSKTGDARI